MQATSAIERHNKCQAGHWAWAARLANNALWLCKDGPVPRRMKDQAPLLIGRLCPVPGYREAAKRDLVEALFRCACEQLVWCRTWETTRKQPQQ
jgi:hypothetical protein